MQRIADFCADQDLPWSETIATSLEQYVDLLLHFNQSMNLIGPFDRDQILTSLIADSVTAAAAFEPFGAILDVGSGAGLPGVVLAILYPEVAVTLVEPRKKRANFLRIVKQRLALSHVEVFEARIEALDPDRRFDYAISKAFRPPQEWIEEGEKWLTERGVLVCMHAFDAPIETTLERVGYYHDGDELRAVSVFRRASD